MSDVSDVDMNTDALYAPDMSDCVLLAVYEADSDWIEMM